MAARFTVTLMAALSVMELAACNRASTPDSGLPTPGADESPAMEDPVASTTTNTPDASGPAPASDSGASFTDLDKNMDSGVARDELAPTELLYQRFNEADTSRDGTLSFAEVERFRSGMAGAPPPVMTDNRSFAVMDANADGRIAHDELDAAEMLERHFEEADADHDGSLSAAEVDSHRAAMAAGE